MNQFFQGRTLTGAHVPERAGVPVTEQLGRVIGALLPASRTARGWSMLSDTFEAVRQQGPVGTGLITEKMSLATAQEKFPDTFNKGPWSQ